MSTNTTPGNYYPQEPTPDLVLSLPPCDAIGLTSTVHPSDLADHKFEDASTFNSQKTDEFVSGVDPATTIVLRLTHDPFSDEKIHGELTEKLGMQSNVQTIPDPFNHYKFFNFARPDTGSVLYGHPVGLVTIIIAGKIQNVTLTRGVLTPDARQAQEVNNERKLAADAAALKAKEDADQIDQDLKYEALQQAKASHQAQLERLTPNWRKQLAPKNINKIINQVLATKPKDPNDPFRTVG